MSRAVTDVPLARDASQRFLPWLVAFMVYLAVLAFLGALTVHKGIQRWDSGLAGHLTVEIPPPQGEIGEGDQAQPGAGGAGRQSASLRRQHSYFSAGGARQT